MTRTIFLTLATTGPDVHHGDRIVEVACVEMVERLLTQNDIHFCLNPWKNGTVDAFNIHRHSDSFLAQQPSFAEVAPKLVEHMTGAELVIHNAAVQIGFLDGALAAAGLRPVAAIVDGITCTLHMARETYPGRLNSVDALRMRLGIVGTPSGDGALREAILLAQVWTLLRFARNQHTDEAKRAIPAQHPERGVDAERDTDSRVAHERELRAMVDELDEDDALTLPTSTKPQP